MSRTLTDEGLRRARAALWHGRRMTTLYDMHRAIDEVLRILDGTEAEGATDGNATDSTPRATSDSGDA